MNKLSPSPAISSSSSSFGAEMCNSRSANASCLTGILRRILCSHTLPTHPSDQFTETTNSLQHQQIFKSSDTDNEIIASSSTTGPGIVARLMGLESLPEQACVAVASSISRSRSLNSVEFNKKYRRVKTKSSFRELPSNFLQLENEKFFVLCFENDVGKLNEERREKSRRKRNRRKKVELNEGNSVRVKSYGETGKIEDPANITRTLNKSCHEKAATLLSHKEVLIREKKKLNCSAPAKEEPEFKQEGSSPVSVLDFHRIGRHLEAPTSGGDTKSRKSNPRRKLSTELDNCTGYHKNPWRTEKMKKCYNGEHYLEAIWKVNKSQVEQHKNIWEVEDICQDFEFQILDHLLEELVDHLT